MCQNKINIESKTSRQVFSKNFPEVAPPPLPSLSNMGNGRVGDHHGKLCRWCMNVPLIAQHTSKVKDTCTPLHLRRGTVNTSGIYWLKWMTFGKRSVPNTKLLVHSWSIRVYPVWSSQRPKTRWKCTLWEVRRLLVIFRLLEKLFVALRSSKILVLVTQELEALPFGSSPMGLRTATRMKIKDA